MPLRFPRADLRHLIPRMGPLSVEFPVYYVRGGTSTGIVIWNRHVPRVPELRDELIRHLMGVPLEGTSRNNRQETGLGRGIPTSNKVFLVEMDETDSKPFMRSTFVQLAANKSALDWSVFCGNVTSALPLFALDCGLASVSPTTQTLELDIFNTNIRSWMTARMSTSMNMAATRVSIPGIAGLFPRVDLFLRDLVGTKTGRLLPTGRPVNFIDGIPVSMVDCGVPVIIVRAEDLGKTGNETPAELDADASFKARMRSLRVQMGKMVGLKKPSGALMTDEDLAATETIPKMCMVAAPTYPQAHIKTRYFTPQEAHPSLPVSGGCCLASACLIPGTVAYGIAHGRLASQLAQPAGAGEEDERLVDVGTENPAGVTVTRIKLGGAGPDPTTDIRAAAITKSAQMLLRGTFPLYQASPELQSELLGSADDRASASYLRPRGSASM